ncbi:MAG: HAD-IA family hydrolase [Rhodospirillales bacterium]|nr:HAD-IA family hydrolase [Rhodospirillales bacterium]
METAKYDAITFDVYGTLIDWEPAILTALGNWAKANKVDATAADLLDAFDRARAHYQALMPGRDYRRILRSAYSYMANEYELQADAQERTDFGDSVCDWPAYIDSVTALNRLKEKFVLGAFTNMDDASFAHSHARLGNCFEIIVTAERVGSYKPSLRHFVVGLTDLAARGIPPERVLHVAQSLRADIRPANLLGQDVVWINRKDRGLGHSGFGAELAVPMATYPSMESFVADFLG